MAEQRLLFIDIEPKSHNSVSAGGTAEKPLWTRTDNSFRFDFLPGCSPAPEEKTSPSDRTEPTQSQISFSGKGSAFAFNFQIPEDTVVEDMDTAETPDTSTSCLRGQQSVREEKPSSQQEVNSPPELSAQSKTKKKKKSAKKKAPESAEAQQTSAEGSHGGENTQLSSEEQLNRELDWCIEQLELGLKCQKGTPKQKEEASRALKTLRSSKAPLVKKRQVMRAMTGEYRKKMEEEKNKQFKLIQSEIASAQVNVVSDSPKKPVFRRRAKEKTQTSAAEGNQHQAEAQVTDLTPQTQEQTPAFVLTPSKEEFRFNFL